MAWFARFVKSRSLAARLCNVGAVHINGSATKKPNQPDESAMLSSCRKAAGNGRFRAGARCQTRSGYRSLRSL